MEHEMDYFNDLEDPMDYDEMDPGYWDELNEHEKNELDRDRDFERQDSWYDRQDELGKRAQKLLDALRPRDEQLGLLLCFIQDQDGLEDLIAWLEKDPELPTDWETP